MKKVDEFKVNTWMRKQGYSWHVGIAHPFDGQWRMNDTVLDQEDATRWYIQQHPWLLLRFLV